MVRLHVAKGCTPTAEILRALLVKEGVQLGNGGGEVCWGAGFGGEHVLNANCSRYNKLQQLDVLDKAGILVVPFGTTIPPLRSSNYPLLARKLKHKGGTDILYCKTPLRCRRALARGRAYFTKFIPSTTEFRVWVYRKRHLGTYEKVLAHPEMKRRLIGRNHRNGFAFQLVNEASIPRVAVDLAIRTITALGLDFGAVDVLVGRDGRYYILECNSAPGVEGEGRQAIQLLAHRIAKWEKAKYPGRASVEA